MWLVGYIYAESFADRKLSLRAALIIGAITVMLFILAVLIKSDTLAALRNGFIVATCVTALVEAFNAYSWVRASLRPVQGVVNLLAYVGLGSYTIYIAHYPLIRFLAREDSGYGIVYVFIAALILVCAAPIFETWLQARVNKLPLFSHRRPVSRAKT